MWGPKILQWGNIDTVHGYFLSGLMKTVPTYLMSFLGLLLLNYTWWSDWGRYVSSLQLGGFALADYV